MHKVCIPGLHLSLGIFDRLWNLLEKACKDLDFKSAVHDGQHDGTSAENFQQLHTLEMEIHSQQEYHSLLSEMLSYCMLTPCSTMSSLVDSLSLEMTATLDRKKSMVNSYTHNNCVLLTLNCTDCREEQT